MNRDPSNFDQSNASSGSAVSSPFCQDEREKQRQRTSLFGDAGLPSSRAGLAARQARLAGGRSVAPSVFLEPALRESDKNTGADVTLAPAGLAEVARVARILRALQALL